MPNFQSLCLISFVFFVLQDGNKNCRHSTLLLPLQGGMEIFSIKILRRMDQGGMSIQQEKVQKDRFFAPGGQKFDTNFFANFKVNVLERERKCWAQIHLIVLGDNNLRETIEREHVQDQIKIKFDQNEALNE
jgi:hypothetical protein